MNKKIGRPVGSKGFKMGSHPYTIAALPIGGSHYIETTKTNYKGIYNRTLMSTKSKAMQYMRFECTLYHCASVTDPRDTIYMAKITRLPDVVEGEQDGQIIQAD